MIFIINCPLRKVRTYVEYIFGNLKNNSAHLLPAPSATKFSFPFYFVLPSSHFSDILANLLCTSLPAPLTPNFLACCNIFWSYKIQTKIYWHLFYFFFLPSSGFFQKKIIFFQTWSHGLKSYTFIYPSENSWYFTLVTAVFLKFNFVTKRLLGTDH